eukprot:767331-Hanusia_phi.AAC.3
MKHGRSTEDEDEEDEGEDDDDDDDETYFPAGRSGRSEPRNAISPWTSMSSKTGRSKLTRVSINNTSLSNFHLCTSGLQNGCDYGGARWGGGGEGDRREKVEEELFFATTAMENGVGFKPGAV